MYLDENYFIIVSVDKIICLVSLLVSKLIIFINEI